MRVTGRRNVCEFGAFYIDSEHQVPGQRMAYPPTDDLEAPRITPAVQWLIAINVAIFFLQLTMLGSATVQQALGFSSRELATSWWTVVTYMFVHGGFLHLALNMYTLVTCWPASRARVERRRIHALLHLLRIRRVAVPPLVRA